MIRMRKPLPPFCVFSFRFPYFCVCISVPISVPILWASLSDNLISLSYLMPPFSANLFGLFLTRLYVSSSKQLTPLKGRPANNVSLSGLSSHLSVPNVEKQCNYAIINEIEYYIDRSIFHNEIVFKNCCSTFHNQNTVIRRPIHLLLLLSNLYLYLYSLMFIIICFNFKLFFIKLIPI